MFFDFLLDILPNNYFCIEVDLLLKPFCKIYFKSIINQSFQILLHSREIFQNLGSRKIRDTRLWNHKLYQMFHYSLTWRIIFSELFEYLNWLKQAMRNLNEFLISPVEQCNCTHRISFHYYHRIIRQQMWHRI